MLSTKRYVLFAMTLTALASGCGSNNSSSLINSQPAQLDPAQIAARDACDGIRMRTRKKVMREFGIDRMVEIARQISAQVPAEDRGDLRRLIRSHTWGVDSRLSREAGNYADQIYGDSIERAGLKRGVGERHTVSNRWITAFPVTNIGSNGFASIVQSSPFEYQYFLGEITNVNLLVNAEQTQYKVLFSRTTSIEKTPSGAPTYVAEYVTMSQYIESTLPQSCTSAGTALTPDQLDLIPSGI